MLSLLRRPKWALGTVIAVAGALLFVSLGLWQVRRLQERQAFNTRVEQRLEAPPVPMEQLLTGGADPEELSWRRVEVSGRWLPDEEVLLSPRSRDGRPGHHVLTPLQYAAGRAVVVDRGWVPLEADEVPVDEAAPRSADVTLDGVLVAGQQPGRFGVDVPEGRTTYLGVVDLDRLGEQVGPELAPVYLLAGVPTGGELPLPPALPERGEGSHLSYAVQWMLFAAVVVVGWPLLLRRRARELRDEGGRPDVDASPDRDPLLVDG